MWEIGLLLTCLVLWVTSCHHALVLFTLCTIFNMFAFCLWQALANYGLADAVKKTLHKNLNTSQGGSNKVSKESIPKVGNHPLSQKSGVHKHHRMSHKSTTVPSNQPSDRSLPNTAPLYLEGPSVRPKSRHHPRLQRLKDPSSSDDDDDSYGAAPSRAGRRGSLLFQELLEVVNLSGGSSDYLGNVKGASEIVAVSGSESQQRTQREVKSDQDLQKMSTETVTVKLDGTNRIKARFKQHRTVQGYYITTLPHDCPFRDAGIRLGDEILEINDIPLAELDLDTMISMCEEYHLNKSVLKILVKRSTSVCPTTPKAVMVKVDTQKDILTKLKSPRHRKGVILVDLKKSCPLHEADLKDGDQLRAINDISLDDLDLSSVKDVLEGAFRRGQRVDVVVVRRMNFQRRERFHNRHVCKNGPMKAKEVFDHMDAIGPFIDYSFTVMSFRANKKQTSRIMKLCTH